MTCDYAKCDEVATTRLTGVRIEDTEPGETLVVCRDHYGETQAVALIEDEEDL